MGCSTSGVVKMEKQHRTPGTRALQDNLVKLAKRAGVPLDAVIDEAAA